MGVVRISEDFITVSELKAKAKEWLRRLGEGGAPLVVTQNGKPAGVLLSPQAFDDLNERARLVGAIQEGLADADAGRVHTHTAVKQRMKERLRRKTP